MDDSYLDREDDVGPSSSSSSLHHEEREEDYDNGRRNRESRRDRSTSRSGPTGRASLSKPPKASTKAASLAERRRKALRAIPPVSGSTEAATESNRCGYPMSWNAEFQKILELPQDDEQQQVLS